MTPGSEAIIRFTGGYSFLSNFHPCTIVLHDDHMPDAAGYYTLTYPSVEHAYQASKTILPSEREWIRRAPSAPEAKRRGDRVTLRAGFNAMKLDIMRQLLLQKFADPVLCKQLLDTGDRQLIEGNWWGDTFWGVSERTQDGENHLGKILMETRTLLRERAQKT